jgi:hypothetical protein
VYIFVKLWQFRGDDRERVVRLPGEGAPSALLRARGDRLLRLSDRAISRWLSPSRSASGKLVAPERRMPSAVMTMMGTGTSDSRCVCFEGNVTRSWPNSSIDMLSSSPTPVAAGYGARCFQLKPL